MVGPSVRPLNPQKPKECERLARPIYDKHQPTGTENATVGK